MNEKVDRYFSLLYPRYDSLTEEEQLKVIREKEFITEHIEEIDKHCKADQRAGITVDSKRVRLAMDYVKRDYYFAKLYPDFNETREIDDDTIKQQIDSVNLLCYINQVHEYCEARRQEGQSVDENMIRQALQQIIQQRKDRIITTREIGEATINLPYGLKIQVRIPEKQREKGEDKLR